MNTPPFFSGDLLLGERVGIGLCTLWTPKSRYAEQLPYTQVIGNLYSHYGIGILIRNVLATPSIRAIVVTGRDNPEPLKRQADALLSGAFDPSDLHLTPEHVRAFYRRTQLYDARSISPREQDALTSLLARLVDDAPRDLEPIVVPLPEVDQEIYPTARSGHLIRAASIPAAHAALLRELRTFGEPTAPDSEGHRRQELWQLTVCLTPACDTTAPLYYHDEIERYGAALWDGDEPAELTYRYGHTMRVRYGDQIAAALEAFRKKPETFRTVISLWEPLDSMLRDDEPCLVTVHPRIRNGVLDMFAYIRTNEMYRGWPKNAAGLRHLQHRFAQELDAALGELTITSGSAHLYDIDWPAVDAYLSQARPAPLLFDAKGDWRFSVDGGQLVAEQYAGGQLLQTIRESLADRLARRVLPFIGDISHALYIGRQIGALGGSHAAAS